MVGADAEKETSKLALWPGPAEANLGGRLSREYDVVDGTNKGSQIYGGDAVFRSIRNGGQDTAAWTESRRGNGSFPESKVARSTRRSVARKEVQKGVYSET